MLGDLELTLYDYPTCDEKVLKKVTKAYGNLVKCENSDYWIDQVNLSVKGKKVIVLLKNAEKTLDKIVEKDNLEYCGQEDILNAIYG